MIFNQSQFYDVVQYAQSKGLDPKLFEHIKYTHEEYTNLFGKRKKRKLGEPFSNFKIKNTTYLFEVKTEFHNSNLDNYTPIGQGAITIHWIGDQNENKKKYNFEMIIFMSPTKSMLKKTYKGRGNQGSFIWDDIYDWAKIWVDNLVNEIHAIESLERINSIPPFFTDSRSYNRVVT
jgi:hypothetical protein